MHHELTRPSTYESVSGWLSREIKVNSSKTFEIKAKYGLLVLKFSVYWAQCLSKFIELYPENGYYLM